VDNTFLKKKFNFPPKATVLKMAVNYFQELLDMDRHTRVFMGLDSFGKEEVLVELAEHFGMYIVVDEKRYELLKRTPLDIDLFSIYKEDGVLEVVRKDQLYSNLKEHKDSVGLILSGWVNQPLTDSTRLSTYFLNYSVPAVQFAFELSGNT
jgi:hypothetical protein